MTSEAIIWDKDALERIKKMPFFVRGLAKRKIEQAARVAGEVTITVEFLNAQKARLMG